MDKKQKESAIYEELRKVFMFFIAAVKKHTDWSAGQVCNIITERWGDADKGEMHG